MALTALTIVSRRSGKPLYMHSFTASSDLLFGIYGQNDADFFGDVLIEEEETQKQKEEWPCEMKYQFMLHAAEDRLDEILAEGKWKKPGATGVDACWIGFLCSIGNSFNAYGYLTPNAVYVAIVEDGMAPDNMELQKSRDNELKTMIGYIHRLYTETLLNPFSSLDAKITSEKFNKSVQDVINGFNQH